MRSSNSRMSVSIFGTNVCVAPGVSPTQNRCSARTILGKAIVWMPGHVFWNFSQLLGCWQPEPSRYLVQPRNERPQYADDDLCLKFC